MGSLFFYSANSLTLGPIQLADPTFDLQERYMIHSLVLSSMLFSFILYRGWNIKIRSVSIQRIKIPSKIFYVIFSIILAAFLLTSLYYSQSVEYLSRLTIKDPISYANRILDKEGLSENSVIIFHGGRVVDYNAIAFQTVNGYSKHAGFNPDMINQEHIHILKKILEDDYKVYTFKSHREGEPSFFRYLEAEHGLILKDYSKTFCKMVPIENIDETKEGNNTKSDRVC